MSDTTLHLPPDWERKTSVRRLGLRLGSLPRTSDSLFLPALAPLYFIRMWTEWTSNPEDWRPLGHHVDEISGHNWKKEDLTFIIEEACGWYPGEEKVFSGQLLVAAIEAGVYELVTRGDISGLVLVGWCELNAHLLPDYESMQSRGGKAARMTKQRVLAARMAEQQATLFQTQGNLMLNAQTQSPEEQKAALALVIQVDRHCGLSVRSTLRYTEAVLRDAVGIVRVHPQPTIDAVLTFLHENRLNPEVVTVPDTVLARFGEYIVLAGKEQG